jgi:hypothetical protein
MAAPEVVEHAVEHEEDGELDDGFAVTLAAEASHGAVALATADSAVRPLEGHAVRGGVMLELELGHGAVAYAQMPPVGLHAVDEHEQDEDSDRAEADAEDGDDAGASALESATEQRRRFRLFRRARAS